MIREKGIEPEVVEYLNEPPTATELKAILKKLGMKAEDLVRKGEEIYKQEFKGQSFSEEEWLDILVAHPKLIERPIVVKGNKAVIGRPPQNVEALL